MAEMKSGSTAEGPYLLGMDIGTGGVRVGIFSRISRAGAYLWAPVISFALIHASAWKGNSAKLNFRFTEFSEALPHSPGPMRQGFLCIVSEVRSPILYIRNGK